MTTSKQTKKIEIDDLKVRYEDKAALNGISFDVYENEILGVIGPAQSGKTTMLKTINRTLDFIPEAKMESTVKVNGEDVKKVKSPKSTHHPNSCTAIYIYIYLSI